jgi:hypothetical protein
MRLDRRHTTAALCAGMIVGLSLLMPPSSHAASAGTNQTQAKDCSRSSFGLVPLNDLGSGLYQGVPGGLYAGGSNQPPFGHQLDGLRISRAIAPLDTSGQSDAPNGRVVLLGLGGNNANLQLAVFATRVTADASRNPQLLAVNGAVAGFDLLGAADPQSAYWDSVATRLRGAGSSPAQVQVAWMTMYVEGALGDFTTSTDSTAKLLTRAIRNARSRLPNLRMLYLTPRIYSGYDNNANLTEPNGYWTGFAFRQVILSQVSGDSLNFDSGRGAVVAPWIDWGPYLWADGMQPRSDGLTWACGDYTGNGYVPSQSGRGVFADGLLTFFQEDATAAAWYQLPSTLDAPDGTVVGVAALSFAAAPNPASTGVTLRVRLSNEPWTLRLVDVQGRMLHSFSGNGPMDLRWDLSDASGTRVRAGVYFARLETTHGGTSRAIVVR